MKREFRLQGTVNANVAELRRYLGSAVRELPLSGLAALLNQRDGRKRSASSIQRWEEGAEPDYASTKLMADLAGVSFEEFALGAQTIADPFGDGSDMGVPVLPPMPDDATEKERERSAAKRRGRGR